MKFFRTAKNAFGFMVDCLFPKCCAVCGRKSDVDGYNNLCSSCLAGIPWIRGPRCSLCSKPMGEGAICGETPPVCDTCKAETPSFRSCMSCWLHRGVGREIVLALKYRQADFLKNDIARLLESNCQDACRFADNAILVPVPINYLRRLGRGYNQTTVIAQAVAKVTDGTEVVNMLSSKPRKSQTKLARNERLLNVKNTFECLPGISSIPKDSRIVLVDDVQTSGATADECCRVLRGVGFENLHVWTLSYG